MAISTEWGGFIHIYLYCYADALGQLSSAGELDEGGVTESTSGRVAVRTGVGPSSSEMGIPQTSAAGPLMTTRCHRSC